MGLKSSLKNLGDTLGIGLGIKTPDGFTDNQDLAKDQFGKITELGEGNNKQMQELAQQMLKNVQGYQLNVDNTVNSALEGINKSQLNDEAKLAAMGQTPRSSNAFSNLYSDYASKKATTEEGIRNNANSQVLQAQMQGMGMAGNMYNTGYNNLSGAYNNAYGAQRDANSAMAAYQQQRGDNLIGLGANLVGGVFGGLF